jgi:hypothetical protein
MVAPPRVHLGERLLVEWGVDCPERNLVRVSVALVGSEIVHRRISARSTLTVVSQRRVFEVLEISRALPAPGLPVAYGLGEVVVPRRTSPSVSGWCNEIAWAIVVEAAFFSPHAADNLLRESFPVTLLGARS